MLSDILNKNVKKVIGLMSGTSADGVDAALTTISGCGMQTRVKLDAYVSIPFDAAVRRRILELASGTFGGTREICLMNALLGQLYYEACCVVCSKAGVDVHEIDLVGCHGQTVYHQPDTTEYLGRQVRSTLQIGDASIICEKMNVVLVSDFRVRDMAAGGQGAPLVPYTEFILYRSQTDNIALQNIGGIGNITFIPANCTMEDIIAFDTGPGNMLIDQAVERLTSGKEKFDKGGSYAKGYSISEKLLDKLLLDPYLLQKPPKTTGREYYGKKFMDQVWTFARECDISDGDVLRTLTRYTAATIAYSIHHYLTGSPDKLIIGGGGSYNLTLMRDLEELLPLTNVITNEDLGISSDAKEAIAFAILANETVCGNNGNVPSATGASHPVILGKISQ